MVIDKIANIGKILPEKSDKVSQTAGRRHRLTVLASPAKLSRLKSWLMPRALLIKVRL